MLLPKKRDLQDKLVQMYQELEDWIIKDIAMRLMKSGELSGTADRELWKLEQMGLHKQEISLNVRLLRRKVCYLLS